MIFKKGFSTMQGWLAKNNIAKREKKTKNKIK
jgi:hypothetical protein